MVAAELRIAQRYQKCAILLIDQKEKKVSVHFTPAVISAHDSLLYDFGVL